MVVRHSLIPLALGLLAVGCAGSHPTAVQQPPAQGPHFLRWVGNAPPQFRAIDPLAGSAAGGGALPSGSGGLSYDLAGTPQISLTRHTATFWAVRGQQRSVQINYLSATGDSSAPFLQLSVTDPAYVPGRGDLAPGDSVLMTVRIDSVNIGVSLEPTGLLFGDSAQLQIWYGGAGGDLNGDAVVDSIDARIEHQLLGLWYREGVASAWTAIPATQSLTDKSFTSWLRHFSDYAVSFSEYAVSW
jgi:hypothetical protein